MKWLVLILAAVAVCGCNEEMRRGRPGSPGYIAKDYRTVRVVLYAPFKAVEIGDKTGTRQAYTVIEDDRRRRYVVGGKIGNTGDEFEMDVSLLKEAQQ